MKSIRKRFMAIREANPGWSGYICFARVVDSIGLSRSALRRWANRLIDSNDWLDTEAKSDCLKALFHYTQTGHNHYTCSDSHSKLTKQLEEAKSRTNLSLEEKLKRFRIDGSGK